MFGELSTIGLTQSVISVRWDPAQPETIPDEAHLVAVIAAAKEQGVKVVLALYPAKARAVADHGAAGFVEFCGRVADARSRTPRRSSSATSRTSRASGSRSSTRTGPGLGRGVSDRAGGLLRHDPRGRQARDRRRALAARQRQPARADRTSRPHRSASSRRLAPPTARAAARRRSWTHSASTPIRTRTPTRRPSATVAERRHAELRPDQAGALGRVQRHGAAPRRERPPALAGRDRLAGPDRGDRRPTPGPRTSRRSTRRPRPPTTAPSSASPPATGRWRRCTSSTGSTSPIATASRAAPSARTGRGGQPTTRSRRRSRRRGAVRLSGIRSAGAHDSVVGASARFTRLSARLIEATAGENVFATYGLVDVGTKRTLTVADRKAVGVALALRSTRSVRAGFGAPVARSTLIRAYFKRRLVVPATRLRASRYVLAVSMAAESIGDRTSLFVGPLRCGGSSRGVDGAGGPVLAETARVSGSVEALLGAKTRPDSSGPRTSLTRSTKPVLLVRTC